MEFEIPQLLGVPLKTHASGPRLGVIGGMYCHGRTGENRPAVDFSGEPFLSFLIQIIPFSFTEGWMCGRTSSVP